MKKFLTLSFIICVLSLGLSACFGSDATDSQSLDPQLYKTYATEEYAIKYPKNYEMKTDFPDSFPQSTEIIFLDSANSSDFKPNINIDKRATKPAMTSIDFATEMLQKNGKDLIGFKKIAEDKISIKVGDNNEDTIIAVFEGKNKSDGKLFKFVQIYAVKGSFAYIATGTMLSEADNAKLDEITKSIKSFEIQ